MKNTTVFATDRKHEVASIGRLAVDSAIKLAAGETLPAEQLLPGFLTTPENAAQFVLPDPGG